MAIYFQIKFGESLVKIFDVMCLEGMQPVKFLARFIEEKKENLFLEYASSSSPLGFGIIIIGNLFLETRDESAE